MKKLPFTIITVVFLCLFYLLQDPINIFGEIVVVHANKAWQMTDIILVGNSTLSWHVEEDDYWSFNTELFPEGHNADGIPVPALESYAIPGKDIGVLIGQISENHKMPLGLSGSVFINPEEGGNYLYLTINDDLIGKYGEGYLDNIGEILVTINQTKRKFITISILLVNGCPGAVFAEKYINDIIAKEGIDADVNFLFIDNDKDAGKLRFIGSPTIRVNGVDVEKGFKDTGAFGINGRTYQIDGKPSNHPSKSMIEAAIKSALSPK